MVEFIYRVGHFGQHNTPDACVDAAQIADQSDSYNTSLDADAKVWNRAVGA